MANGPWDPVLSLSANGNAGYPRKIPTCKHPPEKIDRYVCRIINEALADVRFVEKSSNLNIITPQLMASRKSV